MARFVVTAIVDVGFVSEPVSLDIIEHCRGHLQKDLGEMIQAFSLRTINSIDGKVAVTASPTAAA